MLGKPCRLMGRQGFLFFMLTKHGLSRNKELPIAGFGKLDENGGKPLWTNEWWPVENTVENVNNSLFWILLSCIM